MRKRFCFGRKGLKIPNTFLYLRRAGRITAEQAVLLCLIQDLEQRLTGCNASDEEIAKAWGKSPVHTGRTLLHLRQLGILKVELANLHLDQPQRRIFVTVNYPI